MSETKLWRVYANGHIKNVTKVLGPHIDDDGISRTGYDGDVEAWSKYNKEWRWGCAQIVQRNDEKPFVLYDGCVRKETLDEAIKLCT
jgi:hypothetical protein